MGKVGRSIVAKLHETFVDLDPDCYILLDLPPEQARARLAQESATKDRFESRGMDWWQGLREAYLKAAKELGVTIIDGTGTPEQVGVRVRAACKDVTLWPTELAKL